MSVVAHGCGLREVFGKRLKCSKMRFPLLGAEVSQPDRGGPGLMPKPKAMLGKGRWRDLVGESFPQRQPGGIRRVVLGYRHGTNPVHLEAHGAADFFPHDLCQSSVELMSVFIVQPTLALGRPIVMPGAHPRGQPHLRVSRLSIQDKSLSIGEIERNHSVGCRVVDFIGIEALQPIGDPIQTGICQTKIFLICHRYRTTGNPRPKQVSPGGAASASHPARFGLSKGQSMLGTVVRPGRAIVFGTTTQSFLKFREKISATLPRSGIQITGDCQR